jgi:molybdate transport system substrate-binding protein
MKKLKIVWIFCISLVISNLPNIAVAESITIAAASDLKFALDESVSVFRKSNPQDEVNVIYGSSGKLYTQIQQGAPYDIYFSADISYPNLLAKEGLATGAVIPHAIGRIVLWAPKGKLDASKMSLENLRNPTIKRIAIANPKHAPYGKRAEEALKALDLLPQLESKLVYGENVSQTAQFVQTGNADVGIIALSLALSSELVRNGSYYLIPDNLHAPLEQGFIITKRAEQNLLAQKFANFMVSPEARHIMVKYGFILPHEQQ